MEETIKVIQRMSHISSRIYEGDKDFHIIVELISKVRAPEHLNDYPVRVDIEEQLVSAKIRANTRLWFDEDKSIGWASVDEFNNVWWELDHQHEEGIGTQIVEWGETCIRKSLSNRESITLDASCREDQTERIAFLKRYGFQRTNSTAITMVRDLSKSIPEPRLPQGFAIRPIGGFYESEAIATMHRAAFSTEYMTTENRLAIMNTSEYDPSLDLVAIAPDEAIVAYCLCSVNQANKVGRTDPVATHPRYQRLGLAHALLLTGLRLLKERDMKSAYLGTSGDNIAMQKAAESVGFATAYKTIRFSKAVK